MSGFVPYAFTDAQTVDIRRFCGYPARSDGNLSFGGILIASEYVTLEYKLQHLSQSEGAVVVTTYLTNLYALETAIVTAAANLDTDRAAVWTHNKTEVSERAALFDNWRRRLCAFIGIPPGPDFVTGGGSGGSRSVRMVV